LADSVEKGGFWRFRPIFTSLHISKCLFLFEIFFCEKLIFQKRDFFNKIGRLDSVTDGRFQESEFNGGFPAMNLKSGRSPGDPLPSFGYDFTLPETGQS